MVQPILSRLLALAWAAPLLASLTAHAQLFRAYAASYGNDANPCTVVSPCRLLPAALAAIQDGGEVWMLDSANFNSGPVTIDKNATILAVPGQVGSIVAFGGGNAINVNPGLTVALKNLSVTNNVNNPGLDGIDMTTGKVSIQDSIIAVPNNGIYLNGSGSLSVHNTVFRDATVGVFVSSGGSADVSRSKFVKLTYGVYAGGNVASVTTFAAVRDCEFAKTGTALESNLTASNAAVRLAVHGSSVSGATYGVVAYSSVGAGSAVATVGASTISGSGTALFQNGTGAVLQSTGNNLVVNNGASTQGTITAVFGI